MIPFSPHVDYTPNEDWDLYSNSHPLPSLVQVGSSRLLSTLEKEGKQKVEGEGRRRRELVLKLEIKIEQERGKKTTLY